MHTAKQKLTEKIKESLSSVLPITLLVFLLCITVAPVPAGALLAFIFGACAGIGREPVIEEE